MKWKVDNHTNKASSGFAGDRSAVCKNYLFGKKQAESAAFNSASEPYSAIKAAVGVNFVATYVLYDQHSALASLLYSNENPLSFRAILDRVFE
jgi:hypothetical protein